MTESTSTPVTIGGTCFCLFAYDVGMVINLDEAARLIGERKQRDYIKHKRRAPRSFQYQSAPLRVTQTVESVAVGEHQTGPTVDVVLYDFGSVSVTYAIRLDGPLDGLMGLSDALYDHAALLTDSRRRVEQLISAILPAVNRAGVSGLVEDYAVFQIETTQPAREPSELIESNRQLLARILRCETEALSEQEVNEALGCRISFGPNDAALIDWNSAILFDRDADDVRMVLEFANVDLLEMRHLDRQLDVALDHAYEALSRRSLGRRLMLGSSGSELRRVGQMQADSAMLFEGVNNALKLLGDQYLARVYRGATARLHLPEWDEAILRKLQTVESIYGKLSDQQTTRRMEVLEWIIIILIAVSIMLPFVTGAGH